MMKSLYGFLFSVAFLAAQNVLAQDVSSPDTIVTYDVNLDAGMTTLGKQYRANGQVISKEKYDMYKLHWENSLKCAPCILKTLDASGHPKSEAYSYMDCFIGYYKEFYPDGKIKVEGQFLNFETSSDRSQYENRKCNIRTGQWIYYGANGNKELIENYENGVLISSEVPKANPETDQEKKSVFQKMKEKIK